MVEENYDKIIEETDEATGVGCIVALTVGCIFLMAVIVGIVVIVCKGG